MSPSTSRSRAARRSARSHLRLLAHDEPAADATTPPCDGCEFCSEYFLSGPGWAWRVTAALSRARRARPPADGLRLA